MFACLGLMLDLFHCPFGAAVSLLLTVLGKDIYCGGNFSMVSEVNFVLGGRVFQRFVRYPLHGF